MPRMRAARNKPTFKKTVNRGVCRLFLRVFGRFYAFSKDLMTVAIVKSTFCLEFLLLVVYNVLDVVSLFIDTY